MKKISEFIKPDAEVARSVNLERDAGSVNIIRGYQITDKTREVLGRFADALSGERISAWSLTGPYGMGKSSFINYLLALTSAPNTDLAVNAWQKLEESCPNLFARLSAGVNTIDGQGFLQVPVTASYEPVNSSVLRGIKNALKTVDIQKKSKLKAAINKVGLTENINSQVLLDVIKEVISAQSKPVLIVIDEFGKNLDFMSHHPHKGDIFLLQQLAELDSVYIWVCLHQAFDEYAAGLSTTQRQEWRKIQGRFEDISFVESTRQMLNMITRSIKQSEEAPFNKTLSKWAEAALASIQDTNLSNKSYFTLDAIKSMYPLHPITAISLIELCRRFAQNDRTLLSFLCSGDWGAMPAFLEQEIDGDPALPAMGLDYLYDYFFSISANKPARQAESQRWLEIHDIISEAGSVSAQESALLKTIGVLNLLTGVTGLSASYETVCIIMKHSKGYRPNDVKTLLDSLIRTKGLIYREFAKELRLWEGSDFDVCGAIRTQKAKMAINSLEQLLHEYLPLSPLISSRHAFQTGTVRRFERRWIGIESLGDSLTPATGFDGLFAYCFGASTRPDYIPPACADGRPLLVAYVSSQTTLMELALDIAASRHVFENSPELEHDRVARKEVSFRVNTAEQQFRDHIGQLYSPQAQTDVTWYANGQEIEVNTSKKLSEEISKLCDQCYHKSPHIGNEMINYDKLSSAVARARRELVEAMAIKEETMSLGLTGFGPEVAIYRSLILANGLHCQNQDGWRLTLSYEDERLAALWKQIAECIKDGGEKGVSVIDIIDVLRKPPFGMRMGPAPIYICLYLLVKAEDIVIFCEDRYIPYLTEAAVALLLKRPDLYTLKQFISSGIEQRVFNIYRRLINMVNLGGNIKLRNATMLGVVGPLIKHISALPVYSRNTMEISQEAQKVRFAILNSTEPMRLLFEDLPHAVGMDIKDKKDKSNWQDGLLDGLRKALNDLEQAYPRLNQRIQQVLLEVFDYNDIDKLNEMLVRRVNPLVEVCSDSELKPVLQSIARPSSNAAEWARGIAGIVVKRPLDTWHDHDFMPFVASMRDYADRIDQLEALNAVGTDMDTGNVMLSIMSPGGRLIGRILGRLHERNGTVDAKVQEILAQAKSKKEMRQIVLALVNGLLEEAQDGDKEGYQEE